MANLTDKFNKPAFAGMLTLEQCLTQFKMMIPYLLDESKLKTQKDLCTVGRLFDSILIGVGDDEGCQKDLSDLILTWISVADSDNLEGILGAAIAEWVKYCANPEQVNG